MIILKLDEDQIRDISIEIVDRFVKEGLCPDCTDTNNEIEFEYQDIITNVLHQELLKKMISFNEINIK